MDKKKAICEYLRKNHIGKENAIHSKELEKLFLLDGRNIRRKISALRQDGFPICSDVAAHGLDFLLLASELRIDQHRHLPHIESTCG